MRPKTSVTVGALALAYGLAGGAQAGTLEDVQARGTLNCVVSTGIAGFAYPDDAGEWHASTSTSAAAPRPLFSAIRRRSKP